MATNNELEIVLKLVDQASTELKKITGDIKNQNEDLAKSSDKATKSITEGFKEANKSLNDFRKTMLIASLTVAGIVKTTKDWSEVNDKTKEAYNKLEVALKGISASIGSIFAPAIVALADLVQKSTGFLDNLFKTIRDGYSSVFATITEKTQYLVAFYTEIAHGTNVLAAHADATKIAAEATRELRAEFDASLGTNETKSITDLGEIVIFREKNKEAKQYKSIVDGLTSSFRELGSALSLAGQENKKFAKAAAAVALALAIVHTATGITRAFQDYPWPYSAVVAGIVGAAGAIQVGAIASQNFAQGTDTVPANLSPGEMVFPSSMASAIRRGDITVGGPGGIGGGNTINIMIERADMRSDQTIDQLAEMLGFSIERNLRLARGI